MSVHPTMRARTTPALLFLACLLGGVGVLALHVTFGLGGPSTDELFDGWIYNALMFGSALAVLARAATVRAQRGAWLAMGAGLLSWSLGELYFTLFLEGGVSGVTPADGLFLAMYPCMYVALTLLTGSHLHELRLSMWLDGLIAGLAAATLAAAVVLPPIVDSATSGDAAMMAVSLAYPIGDILLLVFTVGALGVTGWRPGRVWLLIAASMLVSAIADSAYLYETATGGFRAGTWLESLWPAAATLLAVAAWTPWPRTARRRIEDWRLVLVPAVSLLIALGVFVYGNLHGPLTLPALVLAIATVLAVCARLMLTVRENLTMLTGSRQLALTDPLTGLGNRRRLMEDLQVACRVAEPQRQWRLALYDLNGFKRYNDTYGHPAGDELLVRLSARLEATVARHGTAYRMGGDEFCVLYGSATAAASDDLAQACVTALSEQGADFAIGAAHGEVAIPSEAREPSEVLRLADQRLYTRKDATREAYVARHAEAGSGARFSPALVSAFAQTPATQK